MHKDAVGKTSLAVAVTAPPEHGKANAALVRCLSRAWDLAPSRITLVGGVTSRVKTLAVSGPTEELMAKLQPWLTELTT
jgi:uncharacterized protein YggU (UPF0235/DUF167 family)